MILYFDTETSGLHPGQICQLSYIMQKGDAVISKNFFFTVDSVEYGAFMVHGFSVEKLLSLSGGKRFINHFEEISKDFAEADVVVSHNVNFDFSFMRAEYARLNANFAVKKDFCSMKKSTTLCKLCRPHSAGYKYPKLGELSAFLGISDSDILSATKMLFGAEVGFHDARFDTSALYLACNVGMNSCLQFQELKEYL